MFTAPTGCVRVCVCRAGLPTIFHVYAHYVPAEERSRAFGYLIAAGGVGQTVAAVVSDPPAARDTRPATGTVRQALKPAGLFQFDCGIGHFE